MSCSTSPMIWGTSPMCASSPTALPPISPAGRRPYAQLSRLSAQPVTDMGRFRANADRWLTAHADGSVTFLRETRSFVMWWDTRR